MEPVTVQSFEHLMEILREKCAPEDGMYVGSCCEAFYAKHQTEMEEVSAAGVLINLDSTTCYDLGKGGLAYKGEFDNKTSLNLPLIEKTLRRLHEG
jgi:lipoate-protein ligase A